MLLSLDNNQLCGEFYIKEALLQGSSFAKGAVVTYAGYPATVVKEKDSDGDIKVQSFAGVMAIADVLPQTNISSLRQVMPPYPQCVRQRAPAHRQAPAPALGG